MARNPAIAKFLARITACRTAELPGRRLELWAGPNRIGYVERGFAETLRQVTPDITVTERVVLAEPALAALNAIAAAAGCRMRDEDFDVRATPDGPVVAVLDRGALPDFGVIGAGVHLNGLVQRPAGLHLWVATRAANKKLDPGKLDHLVAGGVPAGLNPYQTLLKEAEEEAALPYGLAWRAARMGVFRYDMERDEGLRRDVIHAYDLTLPTDFHPRPADGEVESFALWPLGDVFTTVRDTEDFKFNVNLVLIDLFIRQKLFSAGDAAILRSALG